MSRQTYFYQTERDAEQFFQHIQDLGACILTNTGGINIIRESGEFVSYMSRPINLAIMPETHVLRDSENWKGLKYLSVTSGSYVEFLPCEKESTSVWWHGRVYIHPEEQSGLYNPEILALYNKIIKYIKKNYHYNRAIYDYMGSDFYSQYLMMNGQVKLK